MHIGANRPSTTVYNSIHYTGHRVRKHRNWCLLDMKSNFSDEIDYSE